MYPACLFNRIQPCITVSPFLSPTKESNNPGSLSLAISDVYGKQVKDDISYHQVSVLAVTSRWLMVKGCFIRTLGSSWGRTGSLRSQRRPPTSGGGSPPTGPRPSWSATPATGPWSSPRPPSSTCRRYETHTLNHTSVTRSTLSSSRAAHIVIGQLSIYHQYASDIFHICHLCYWI